MPGAGGDQAAAQDHTRDYESTVNRAIVARPSAGEGAGRDRVLVRMRQAWGVQTTRLAHCTRIRHKATRLTTHSMGPRPNNHASGNTPLAVSAVRIREEARY